MNINRESGFSLTELLVVVIIIGILAALTIPSLVSSTRAASEQTAKSKLATMGASETTFRTLLAKRRYTTLSELQTTLAGGVALLSSSDVTVSGWTFSEVTGSISSNTFGLKAVPANDNPRDLSFALFEDQVLRVCPRAGPWTRSCQQLDQASGTQQTSPTPTPSPGATPTPTPSQLPIGAACSNDNQCSTYNCNAGVCGPAL